jgi:gamma-glutamyltranspeptidase/glutathione hydrolase
MDPQAALDAPRFCIEDGTSNGIVSLEEGIDPKVVQELIARGHKVRVVSGAARAVFGRGQIIQKTESGVLWSGSDGRADGCAFGY